MVLVKRFFALIFIVFMLVFAVILMIQDSSMTVNNVRNEGHANSKHAEAPRVRELYRNEICEGTELWFSPLRGTVLVLCGIPDSYTWGGLIFRVTENMGQNWLGKDAYECSVFVSHRSYWTKVIKRDKYVPLGNWPDIERMFVEWYH